MKHRNEFIVYLQGKNLAASSITHYTYCVELFCKRIQKDVILVTQSDILKHLEYLKNHKGQQNITRRNNLIALNHYFTFLYATGQIVENPCLFLKIRGTKRRTLYKIYSSEELEQLYDHFYHSFVRNYEDSHIPKNQRRQSALSRERNAAIVSLLVCQGTTTKEIDMILVQDMDLIKATLKIRGGRKSNERILPLKASQIGLLMHYLQTIRPQFLDYVTADNEKLFFPLPEYSKKNTSNEIMMNVFKPLTKQVQSIDKHFLNFKQIRASVITYWLKTHGLRKTQYMAGHRYISSTENYLPNNLEGLTDDIDKLHPF